MSEQLEQSFTIQVRLDGWGNESDLDLRYDLEEAMEDHLRRHGLGILDGGDIGSGTLNVFIYTTSSKIAELVTRAVSEVECRGLCDRTVIAVWNTEDEDGDYEVVWPEGFEGEFSII